MKDIQSSKFFIIFLQIGFLLHFSSSASIPKDDKSAKQPKCVLVPKNPTEMKDNWESCHTSLNIELPKDLEDDEEAIKFFNELEKSGFDDKCLGKCVAEKYNMLLPDGHINKAAYSDFLQNFNASVEIHKILNDSYLRCVDKVEIKAKEEGGMRGMKEECKYMGMFRHCLFFDGMKNRDEIDSLCQKS